MAFPLCLHLLFNFFPSFFVFMPLFGGHLGTLLHCCSFGSVLVSRTIRAAHCLTSIQVSTSSGSTQIGL